MLQIVASLMIVTCIRNFDIYNGNIDIYNRNVDIYYRNIDIYYRNMFTVKANGTVCASHSKQLLQLPQGQFYKTFFVVIYANFFLISERSNLV